MKSEVITAQRSLWDLQHLQRGNEGEEAAELRDVPNNAAVHLDCRIAPGSTILEIGSANGRDARFWARKGHSVIAMDFSRVALDQLEMIAKEQGVEKNIKTVEFDLNEGSLPVTSPPGIDAFFARSALHISDRAMYDLSYEINRIAKRGAVIMIEGKTESDPKIKRSFDMGNGLRLDHDGHLRRSYTEAFMEELANNAGWSIDDMRMFEEKTAGKGAEFLRMTAKVWRTG